MPHLFNKKDKKDKRSDSGQSLKDSPTSTGSNNSREESGSDNSGNTTPKFHTSSSFRDNNYRLPPNETFKKVKEEFKKLQPDWNIDSEYLKKLAELAKTAAVIYDKDFQNEEGIKYLAEILQFNHLKKEDLPKFKSDGVTSAAAVAGIICDAMSVNKFSRLVLIQKLLISQEGFLERATDTDAGELLLALYKNNFKSNTNNSHLISTTLTAEFVNGILLPFLVGYIVDSLKDDNQRLYSNNNGNNLKLISRVTAHGLYKEAESYMQKTVEFYSKNMQLLAAIAPEIIVNIEMVKRQAEELLIKDALQKLREQTNKIIPINKIPSSHNFSEKLISLELHQLRKLVKFLKDDKRFFVELKDISELLELKEDEAKNILNVLKNDPAFRFLLDEFTKKKAMALGHVVSFSSLLLFKMYANKTHQTIEDKLKTLCKDKEISKEALISYIYDQTRDMDMSKEMAGIFITNLPSEVSNNIIENLKNAPKAPTLQSYVEKLIIEESEEKQKTIGAALINEFIDKKHRKKFNDVMHELAKTPQEKDFISIVTQKIKADKEFKAALDNLLRKFAKEEGNNQEIRELLIENKFLQLALLLVFGENLKAESLKSISSKMMVFESLCCSQPSISASTMLIEGEESLGIRNLCLSSERGTSIAEFKHTLDTLTMKNFDAIIRFHDELANTELLNILRLELREQLLPSKREDNSKDRDNKNKGSIRDKGATIFSEPKQSGDLKKESFSPKKLSP